MNDNGIAPTFDNSELSHFLTFMKKVLNYVCIAWLLLYSSFCLLALSYDIIVPPEARFAEEDEVPEWAARLYFCTVILLAIASMSYWATGRWTIYGVVLIIAFCIFAVLLKVLAVSYSGWYPRSALLIALSFEVAFGACAVWLLTMRIARTSSQPVV